MHGPKYSPLSEPLASNTGLTMPSRTLLALTTAALLGLIIAGTYAPATAMSFENYPRLTGSEFALFQADAENFAEALACQGVTIGKHDSSRRFFDISVRGDAVLFVDNSGPSLLIVTMPAVASDEIGLERWKDGWGSPERRRRNLSPPENSCPPLSSK
ncbi:hypothetical protein I5W42_18220 [Stenotrophomonas maltophilia]|nr:hypothetical protein [Stenotrophomonas maltophilia]